VSKDILNLGLKNAVKQSIARYGYSIQKLNELTQLADRFGSDKGTRLSAHMYTRIYHKFFNGLRNCPICLLEIGLLRSDIDSRRETCATEGTSFAIASHAPSLEMWRRYFPNAEIFGFDVDDFSGVKIDRCTILRGDMSSRTDLVNLLRSVNRPIDILIEDGSHASHHQQIALGTLFPAVQSGGMYIIEDLHWQNDRIEQKNAPKTRDLLRRLQVQGTLESPYLSSDERLYIQENTAKVWLFDSMTHDVEDSSDAIGFLIKK
jgi:hypothetical protein